MLSLVMNQVEARAIPRAIADLARVQPTDATLKNLLRLLDAKLEMCARLPVFEWEADHEGFADCAAAFRRLAEAEHSACGEVMDALRIHLQSHNTAASGVNA